MKTWRRLAVTAAVATAALAASAPAVVGQGPGPGDDPTGEEPTPAEDLGFGDPQADGVVHSWALTPASVEGTGNRPHLSFVADPGTIVEDAITIYNLGNVQLTFRVHGTDAFNDENGQFALLPGSETPTDVGTWVSFPQEYITVMPGQQITMPVTLTIPADAAPGDHTGAVLASSEAVSASPDGNVVNLDRRTGTRIYLRVNGPIEPALAVEQLETSYRTALNPLAGSVEVTYRIENRGNVRLSGTHRVSVAGPFGFGRKQVPAAEFPELLPGQGMTVVAVVDDVPALLAASTTVELEPAPSGDSAGLAGVKRTATTVALPVTVLLALLALMLGVVARRAYRRHRDTPPDDVAGGVGPDTLLEPDGGADLWVEPQPEPEPQPT